MGTNFYLTGPDHAPCGECGRGDQPWHIGKSSAGWVFALRVYPNATGMPRTLTDWIALFFDPDYSITDEYGKKIEPDDMVKRIAGRRFAKDASPWPEEELKRNHAVKGPRGLARAEPNGSTVIHGEGTWDYHTEEFS